MALISSFHFQVFFACCAVVLSASLSYASNAQKFRRQSDHRFGAKVVFPETVVSDKYDLLITPALSRDFPLKNYYRKDYKYKPYVYKYKPTFRYNYSPYAPKGSLYQITQDLLKKTQLAIGVHQNDSLHDPGIKPVVEDIKDDIKYDFRTKTHYYEK